MEVGTYISLAKEIVEKTVTNVLNTGVGISRRNIPPRP